MATVKSVVVVHMDVFLHRAVSIDNVTLMPTVPEARVAVMICARTQRVVSVDTVTMMEIVPVVRAAVAMNVETALIAKDFPVKLSQIVTSGNPVAKGLALSQTVFYLRLLQVVLSQTIEPVSSLARLLVQSYSVVWFPSVCISEFAVARNRHAKEPYQNRD